MICLKFFSDFKKVCSHSVDDFYEFLEEKLHADQPHIHDIIRKKMQIQHYSYAFQYFLESKISEFVTMITGFPLSYFMQNRYFLLID